MQASLWNSVNGYVKIKIEGLSQEKFLNLAAENGIVLWDVRRQSYTLTSANMSVANFRKLRRLGKRAGCRVHLSEKKGVPFLLNRFRFRRVLLLGAVVCLAMLYAVSLFVWDIRIEGAQKVDPKSVRAVVKKRFPERSLRARLDMGAIENDVVRSDKRIAWAGARLEGTTLVVEIVEGVLPPQMVDKNSPASIVAAKDAIVEKLTALEGRMMAEEGQRVKAGDVLINGFYEGKESAPARFVHARGFATGRTWYTATAGIERKTSVTKRSGKVLKSGRIRVAGLDVGTKSKFAKFEGESGSSTWVKNLFLPLEFQWEQQYELIDVPVELSDEEMRTLLEKAVWEQVEPTLPRNARLIEKSVDYFPTKTGMLATIAVEMLEDIASTVPIDATVPTAPETPNPNAT